MEALKKDRCGTSKPQQIVFLDLEAKPRPKEVGR
jgi:hypothetical protein